MRKITPFLMFNDQLGAALDFYMTLPDSRILSRAEDGSSGQTRMAEFIVGGQPVKAFNGGDHFKFSQAFSFFVDCNDQEEVDLYWNRILEAGGKAVQCGWMTDPFGVSWQIVPRQLMEMMSDPDPARATAVREAMLKMVKLDVGELKAAYDSA